MMVSERILFISLLVCCLAANGCDLLSPDSEIKVKIKDTLAVEKTLGDLVINPDNYIQILSSHDIITEKEMQAVLKKYGHKGSAGTRHWANPGKPPYTSTALGADNQHHFANAYLTGWVPFETEHRWVPPYVVAMRMQYRPDYRLFKGKQDVWQTAHSAFIRAKGDCEDHAILLADWLIDMGLDARVVLGKYKSGLHAWVVVLENDTFFLLEATSKLKKKRWRHYPLAKIIKDYHPHIMFNLDSYWVNTGSRYTTDYQSDAWVETSRYHADSE